MVQTVEVCASSSFSCCVPGCEAASLGTTKAAKQALLIDIETKVYVPTPHISPCSIFAGYHDPRLMSPHVDATEQASGQFKPSFQAFHGHTPHPDNELGVDITDHTVVIHDISVPCIF